MTAKTYYGLGIEAGTLPPAATPYERWVVRTAEAYERAVAESVEHHFQELVDFNPPGP